MSRVSWVGARLCTGLQGLHPASATTKTGKDAAGKGAQTAERSGVRGEGAFQGGSAGLQRGSAVRFCVASRSIGAAVDLPGVRRSDSPCKP